MKTYIGIKTIKATPAYKGEDGSIYLYENGVPSGVNVMSLKEGYKIIDEDGYTSWSPKYVFENTYHIADTFRDISIMEIDELLRLDNLV